MGRKIRDLAEYNGEDDSLCFAPGEGSSIALLETKGKL
jgi:hypothetical protein